MKKEKVIAGTAEPKEKTTEKAVAAEPKKVDKNVNKVGKLLKEMRLQKEYSLSDVSKKLCIRKIYLEAIEESNYKELPPLPYGVGFIRSYAEFLGLNSGNIVELYKEETNSNPDKDIFVLEPQNEATVPNRKYLLISLLSIILIYALWYFYNNGMPDAAEDVENESSTETVMPEEKNEFPLVVEDYSLVSEGGDVVPVAAVSDATPNVVAEQVTITDASFPLEEEKATAEPASETPVAVPAASEEKTPAAVAETPVEGVVLKIKKETWIEVKDAEKLYISKVLQAGDSYKVPSGPGMILSVGRVEAVDVLINGKVTPVAQPGKKTNIPLDPFLSSANH